MGEWIAGLSPNGSKNKPAGIRALVYGIGKGKARIEGLCVSGLDQAEHKGLFGRFLAITDSQRLVDTHSFVADRGD